MFIDCRKAYSHSTSDNLWSLQWCHFYAPFLPAVYEKYKERGGHPVFHSDNLIPFTSLLTDLYNLACFLSSTFPRKKRRNSLLSSRDFPCFQRALCIPAHKGMLHSVAFPFEDQ